MSWNQISGTRTNIHQSSWPRVLYTPQPTYHRQQLATPALSMLLGTLQEQSFTVYQVQATRPLRQLVELSLQPLLWLAPREAHPALWRSSCQCRRSLPQLLSHPRHPPQLKRSLLRIRLRAKFSTTSLQLDTRLLRQPLAASLLRPQSRSPRKHLQAQSKVCLTSFTFLWFHTYII